jgi:4-amino-4-deoxy-L-arabinose transferase-like glycosyltransferase
VTLVGATAACPDRSRWAWLSEPSGTLALLLAWAGFHALLRLVLSSALTADDAREAVLAQSLEWGYQGRQPPLYNWLVWGAFRLLGPGLLALTLLKYAVLVLAFWLVYLTARRILADPRLATLGAFSFLLIVPISWTIHEALTHSVTVLAACAGTVYALVRLEVASRARAYAGLGLAVGLGLLSKFTYVIFLVALALATLTVDRYRARLLHPGVLVAGLVATALVFPFALWFVGEGHDLGPLYAREVRIEDGDDWAAEAGVGLVYVARIAAYYLAPVGAVLAACVPVVYRRLPRGAAGPAGGRLLGWLLAWVLVLLSAAALAGGLGFLKFRWLIPGFFLAPLYALWRLERQGGPGNRLAALTAVLIVAELAVVGALAVRVMGASFFPRPYRMNEPYDAVAAGLARAGFTRGTILAGFGTLAGNLAVRFPDSRVLHTEYPDFRPPGRGDHGQCLLTWDRQRGERGEHDTPGMPDDLRALAATLGVPLAGSEPVGVVEAPLRFDRRHVRRVYYVLLLDGAGHCH